MSTPPEPVLMDPPAPFSRTQDLEWAPIAAALMERTGEWALVLVGGYSETGLLVGRIKKQRGVWAGHQWEATTRNTGSSKSIHVYARHMKPLEGQE